MSAERNYVMVRLADPKMEPVKEWITANSERNAFDPAILDYPAMKVLASHCNGTTYTYMPVQAVAVLESIGVNPEAKPLEIATGVMESVKSAVVLAQANGYRELWFLGSDETTARGAETMGFEPLPYRVFRKRI
jgi:hypothetical protein